MNDRQSDQELTQLPSPLKDLAGFDLAPPGSPVRSESEEGLVEYFFPVEIEVRAAEPVDVEEIIELTLNRLANRLENS